MRTYPPGSRFHPTQLGLVKLHLKKKVEKNISGFIKTLNVYGDAPWRLEHDTNHLYPRNEWYYFVPRKIRGKKTVSRIVPSNGESLGGTWKSLVKKQEIMKNKEELMGFKTELIFNKNVVVDGKLEQEKTDWRMDEYSLVTKGEEFLDLVLCHVRLLHSDERFQPMVPPARYLVENNNNVLQNQEQQQEAGFANHNNDMMMMVETNQQQQEEQQDSLIPFQSNDNLEEHYPLENIAYHGTQHDMTTGYGVMQTFNQGNHVNQQQQHDQQQDSLNLIHPPFQSNDNVEHYPLEDIAYHGTENNDMTGYGYGVMQTFNQGNQVNQQHEQQQQDSLNLQHPPLQNNNNSNIEQQRPYAYHVAEEGYMTTRYDGLEEIFNQGRNHFNHKQPEQHQGYSPALPLQTNVNQEQYSLEDIAYHGAEVGDMTTRYEGLMEIFKHFVNQRQHEQQQEVSQALPLQTIVNQEHCPCEDYDFDGSDDDLTIEVDIIMKVLNEGKEQQDSPTDLLPPLQSNDNHGHECPLVPSQHVENNENNNNNVLPNQEQREADDFANHNDMPMVAKEHGDVKQEDLLLAPQRNDNQEEEHHPLWNGFGNEDDLIPQNMDQTLTPQQLQYLETCIDAMKLSF